MALNLFDLIKRRDRTAIIEAGFIDAEIMKFGETKANVVKIGAHSRLRLQRADEFYTLRGFPTVLNWFVSTLSTNTSRLIVQVLRVDSLGPALILADQVVGKEARALELNWDPIIAKNYYDIHFINPTDHDVFLNIGKLFDPRKKLRPLLKGNGVEVGPGLNPQVLPASGVNIKYLESTPPQDWLELYGKNSDEFRGATVDTSLYIIGDAHDLSIVDDGSLDFIFSNHVFEHLMNPKQVLRNWAKKISKGGIITGVVPDCRYSFDLRQSPSTIAQIDNESVSGTYETPLEKYLAWCRYTAPYNTPEDLIRRKYSIHVHFYTPSLIIDLAEGLVSEGILSNVFVDTYPNSKDFGFVFYVA